MDGHKPAARAIARKPAYTRKLLREWPKLEVGRDGLLRRRSGDNLQLVFFHPFFLLGITPGNGPLKSRESIAVSSGEVLLALDATRYYSLDMSTSLLLLITSRVWLKLTPQEISQPV